MLRANLRGPAGISTRMIVLGKAAESECRLLAEQNRSERCPRRARVG